MSETHELLKQVWNRELSADEAYDEITDKYDQAADRVLELQQQLQHAHRQGWEQAKKEAVEVVAVVDNRSMLNTTFRASPHDISIAIASMEYKEKQND